MEKLIESLEKVLEGLENYDEEIREVFKENFSDLETWVRANFYRAKHLEESISIYKKYGFIRNSNDGWLKTPIYERVACLKEWDAGMEILNSAEQPNKGDLVFWVEFPTGSYIFGDDWYDRENFKKFFGEIKGYNPNFVDDKNHEAYWVIGEDGNDDAKALYENLGSIYAKYKAIHEQAYNEIKRERLLKELEELK